MALIFQGALDGLGVGLSQRCYLAQDLAAGRLHQVSPVVLTRNRGFHLVCRPETMNLPAVQAFVTWIESLPKPHDSAL
jgi:LysR family transcriptional regulator, glycine cleavage system transcriptional activator